ncbi:MAG: cholesterol esterase [Piccolia ochrophora]|nr:MAG: cholesterol esterase [Piccolia ochrophora]
MARVPFIGRLFLSGSREYLALFGSFILIGLEGFIRVVTLALPRPIIHGFYRGSRRLFNLLSPPQKKIKEKTKGVVSSADIRDTTDFVDLCALHGYYAEEHVVQTTDGYLLGLHRLGWRQGEERSKVNNGKDSIQKRVVYLHHGLLMNSEVWVCMTDKKRCLPFQLVEKGFDVWFGNNRGNKYSKKATNRSPTSNEFWNFSMDEFAFHDVPDSIAYILNATSQPSLSYIGFSQGTAQAFAALSIHPRLNDQVDVFIALAPAMSPAGLSNGVVDSLVKASPEVIFLAFGRRSILSSATMWQALLYPPLFVRIIDTALSFLFNWSCRNISADQKLAAYPHLYSFTSTKSVVHWFQIIRNKSFQMYDDDVQAPLSIGGGNKYYKVAKFPTRNIKTPIVLVYGGSDSLIDIDVMLKELPKHTVATRIPHYEHLDFLWASSTATLVFPHVFHALDSSSPSASDDSNNQTTTINIQFPRPSSPSSSSSPPPPTNGALSTSTSRPATTPSASQTDLSSPSASPSSAVAPSREKQPNKLRKKSARSASLASSSTLISDDGGASSGREKERERERSDRPGVGEGGIKLGMAKVADRVVSRGFDGGEGFDRGSDSGATAGEKRRR